MIENPHVASILPPEGAQPPLGRPGGRADRYG